VEVDLNVCAELWGGVGQPTVTLLCLKFPGQSFQSVSKNISMPIRLAPHCDTHV